MKIHEMYNFLKTITWNGLRPACLCNKNLGLRLVEIGMLLEEVIEVDKLDEVNSNAAEEN